MGKIKRGNYQFFTWIGDHGSHVHVHKDNRLILKYDLETKKAVGKRLPRRLRKFLEELIEKGLL